MFPLPGLIQNSHFRSYRNPIKKLKTDPTKSEIKKKKYKQNPSFIIKGIHLSYLLFLCIYVTLES
jgi:hypothetical protein